MPSQQPAVLIVHGAFHVPQHFDHLASLLRRAGYQVDVPALPSVGVEQDPGNALELDAGFLFDRLEELVGGKGRDVVVLMHSYGGQVMLMSLFVRRDDGLWIFFFSFFFCFKKKRKEIK